MIKRQTPYVPKIWLTLLYLLLLGIVMLLFMGRTMPALRSGYLMYLWPDFYQHVSNFTISYLFFSIISYTWLMIGVPLKKISMVGLAVITGNFIYELLIPFINTRDLTDAYYGVAGVCLGYLFLYVAGIYGMRLNPDRQSK